MRLQFHIDGRPVVEVIAAPVFVEPAALDDEGTMWRVRFHAHQVPVPIDQLDAVRATSGGAFPLNWEAVRVSIPPDALAPSVDFTFIEGT